MHNVGKNLMVQDYFLGNIPPMLRSFLIACVTVPNLMKYGFEPVLATFIEDVNKLKQVCSIQCMYLCLIHPLTGCKQGVTMTIAGKPKLVRGAVLFALADTLAAHDLGGFKIGVGFALRKCRTCLATGPQISQKVRYHFFLKISYISCSLRRRTSL